MDSVINNFGRNQKSGCLERRWDGVPKGSSVALEGPYLDLGGGNTYVHLGKKSLSFTLKIYAVYSLYIIPHFT